jgi:dTDP-4-amino-4,6-dideoxygalactose transaminase
MARGLFVLGEEVTHLEDEIAHLCGVRHGVGVNSGTDALLLSLLALGVGPCDEVITTAFTFFATSETIALTGAKPVFVDIKPDSFNIDPAAIEAAVTPRTRAIIPVHLYGQLADMDAIKAIADRHGLAVLEDAAQGVGASYKGRPCGSFGNLAALSFYPTKNLGAFGDGGMVITNDDALAEKVRLLRSHGSGGSYYYRVLGYNSRLDEVQAAVVRVKLRHLPRWNDLRRRHAEIYNAKLDATDVKTPKELPERFHIYHQYTIRCAARDSLKEHLSHRGVDSGIYYPLPLHLQEVHADLGYGEGDLPHSEQAAKEVLSLPVYPELKREDIEYVADQIAEFTGS